MSAKSRRAFLKASAVQAGAAAAASGLAAGVVAGPAVAQSAPELTWRMQSSFPKSLEIIHGSAEYFARALAELTDGRFKLAVYPSIALSETADAIEAAASRRVEMAYTMSAYGAAKDSAFHFGTSIPFGLDQRLQSAWLAARGGNELLTELYATHGLVGLPAGSLGAAMGGWSRREIKSIEDLKGLKIRLRGLGADVLKSLGAEPQTVEESDLVSALQQGRLDAAVWFNAYDDDNLGLFRSAKNYLYPGWWSGGTTLHAFFNKAAFDGLPKAYQAALRAAARLTDAHMLARYDAVNPTALRRLVAGGAELKPLPEPVLDACFKAATETCDALAKANPRFQALYDSMKVVRGDNFLFNQLAEHTFDTYMMIQQRKRLL